MIHPLSDVQTTNIGENTTIWQYTIVLEKAIIGNNCNINSHCFIENNVVIGDNTTVKCGVYLWDGITMGNNVFIGPNVTFTNDKFPHSKVYPETFQKIMIEDMVSVGAGSIILGGVSLGKGAMIGAGSLVTKDVPEGELWYGNPAKFIRKIDTND